MRQFITIATNAFMELVRQPVFLLLMTSSAVFEIFLATPYYFAFGDEPKLVKNSTLAVMLLTYVNLVACLLASRMAFDAYGSTDLFAVGVFVLSLIAAYLLGGF